MKTIILENLTIELFFIFHRIYFNYFIIFKLVIIQLIINKFIKEYYLKKYINEKK